MDSFTQFDGNLLIGIQQALNADWLTPIMKAITYLAEYGIVWIIICLILIICKRTRRLGIICSLSLALTFICCNLGLKLIVDRARPWTLFEGVVPLLPDPGDSSFPSGHTASASGAAWGMFLTSMPRKIPKEDGTPSIRSYDAVPCLGWRGNGADPQTVHRFSIIAIIAAVLIGISRLYLGMHYPSDVMVGFLLGLICAVIVCSIMNAIEQKHGHLIGSVRWDAKDNRK